MGDFKKWDANNGGDDFEIGKGWVISLYGLCCYWFSSANINSSKVPVRML